MIKYQFSATYYIRLESFFKQNSDYSFNIFGEKWFGFYIYASYGHYFK